MGKRLKQLFHVIMLAKYFSILELNWYQRFEEKPENLISCAHVVHITTKHVISRQHRGKGENAEKCSKMEIARATRAKLLFVVRSLKQGRRQR